MPLRRTLVFAASVLLMAGAAILNSRSSRRSHCLGSTNGDADQLMLRVAASCSW